LEQLSFQKLKSETLLREDSEIRDKYI